MPFFVVVAVTIACTTIAWMNSMHAHLPALSRLVVLEATLFGINVSSQNISFLAAPSPRVYCLVYVLPIVSLELTNILLLLPLLNTRFVPLRVTPGLDDLGAAAHYLNQQGINGLGVRTNRRKPVGDLFD
jgi:hypothetical protein